MGSEVEKKIIQYVDIKEPIIQGVDWFNYVDLTIIISDDSTRGREGDKNPGVKVFREKRGGEASTQQRG